LVPAQPRWWLAGFGGQGLPGPAGAPAVTDVAGDAVEAKGRGALAGALLGRVPLGGVSGAGEPVAAQRGRDGMVGQAGLGGDGVDGLVLDDVSLAQVTGYIREAEPAQGRQPPGVPPFRPPLACRRGRPRVDVTEVT
jgi:hypothetical protein